MRHCLEVVESRKMLEAEAYSETDLKPEVAVYRNSKIHRKCNYLTVIGPKTTNIIVQKYSVAASLHMHVHTTGLC